MSKTALSKHTSCAFFLLAAIMCVNTVWNFASAGEAAIAGFAPTQMEVPTMPPAGVYELKNNTVEMELSEYAGYAGVIVANGGLAANENSLFFKKYGFKLNIKLSEEESRPQLNSGKMAALATTVDVLPLYGKQFHVSVPLLISYSRGGDGIVVRNEIKDINGLKGKILVCAQFTESDFLIRYFAQRANLEVNLLPNVKATLDPAKINLVFSVDAFGAGDLFLADIKSGRNQLAGCVTWDPKTTEVAEQSGGKARILITNRNLLVVADILVLNKGFAQQHPDIVSGLVAGWLEGNRLIRENAGANVEPVMQAFKWDREKYKIEMAKVHLANGPEDLAFFKGAMDATGPSYAGIYQSTVDAYSKAFIKDPVDSEYFLDLKPLKGLEQSGTFKSQSVAIGPITRTGGPVEQDPKRTAIASKDIRFYFAPNSADLLKNDNNQKYLENVRSLLQDSPGSVVLLRGHVDDHLKKGFEEQGGKELVQKMALVAKELSRNRAKEVKRLLVESLGVNEERLEIFGVGWDEPVGKEDELNRRVEIKWLLVE